MPELTTLGDSRAFSQPFDTLPLTSESMTAIIESRALSRVSTSDSPDLAMLSLKIFAVPGFGLV